MTGQLVSNLRKDFSPRQSQAGMLPPITANKGALMIFRAIFWIGLVSLLTPHEPDLGLGRPGAGTSLSAIVKSWAPQGLSRSETSCDGDLEACAGGLGPSASGRSLADVKAEIDESIKARGGPLYAL